LLEKEMVRRLIKWSPEIANRANENKVKCLRISDKKATGLETFLVAFGPDASELIDRVIAPALAKP